MIRLGNNEVLKTVTKTLIFVDADANAAADAGASTISPRERCSGELENNVYPCKPQFYYIKVWSKEVILI